MQKLLSLLGIFCLFFLQMQPAFAQIPDDVKNSLPEQAGVYEVSGHSHLKLHVFVHTPRPTQSQSKPGPSTPPELMCTLTDPDSNAVDGATGWHIPDGNWEYHLNPATVPSLIGTTNLRTLTSNVFATWSTSAVNTHVNFISGSDTSLGRAAYDNQNIIAWGRTSGTALAVTYTWYNQSTGEAVETDTIFNKKFQWDWANQSTTCAYINYYDAQNILTHELGHWMGLDDEYTADFTNNTMYGYGSKTEVKKNTLTTGDYSAMSSLY